MSERFDEQTINKFQKKIIRMARNGKLSDGFKKNEIEKLKKKYGYDHHSSEIDERVNAEIIDDIEEWMDNLDLSKP